SCRAGPGHFRSRQVHAPQGARPPGRGWGAGRDPTVVTVKGGGGHKNVALQAPASRGGGYRRSGGSSTVRERVRTVDRGSVISSSRVTRSASTAVTTPLNRRSPARNGRRTPCGVSIHPVRRPSFS